jgi:hypothetical protein
VDTLADEFLLIIVVTINSLLFLFGIILLNAQHLLITFVYALAKNKIKITGTIPLIIYAFVTTVFFRVSLFLPH